MEGVKAVAGKEALIIEVLTTSGCDRCQKARAMAKSVIAEFDEADVQYREINVVEKIDYAVRLGVMAVPAIALNGKLVFPAPPSKVRLRQAIQQRLTG